MNIAMGKRLDALESTQTTALREYTAAELALHMRAHRHYHGKPLEDGDLPVTPEMQEMIDAIGEFFASI